MSIPSWHETDCRKPDVVLMDNMPSCFGCGSVYVWSQNEDRHRGELSVTMPLSQVDAENSNLFLDWPRTITFSSPDDIEDGALRDSLLWHQRSAQIAEDSFLETPSQDDRLLRNRNGDCPPDPASIHPLYTALTGRDEIRLLRLSSSASGDGQVLHGTLHNSRLAHRPDFVALSYTWANSAGDRSRCETIFLGNEWAPFPVTANCAAALRCLRSRSDASFVWVDAICIDQKNTDERSHQVGQMRDIYSRARKVIMFLGDDGTQETPDGTLMERMSEECFYAGKQAKIAWFGPRDFGALAALFERPYWARIWVVQEVLLAREAIVVLGKSSVPLDSLLKGQMVETDKFHVSHVQVFPPWTQLTGPSIDGDVDAFSEMLIKASPCCASDGRDKVFALLGLIQGGHLEGLVADYSKKLDVVYTGIAAYFLIRHAQSKILKWAALSQSPLSWVPAWHWNQMVDQIPRQSIHPSPLTRLEEYSDFKVFPSSLTGQRLEEYSDYNVFPDHPCRASSLTGQHPGIQDVLSVLRPRVFSKGGVLSIHAYPVIQAYSANGAFNMDFHESNDVSEFRAADRGIYSYDLPWSICATSQLDALYSWIIEVPNCDVFLHLKPQGLIPNIFKIKSVCHLNLVTDRRMPLLDLNPPSTQGSSTFSSARDLDWTAAPQLLFDTHQLPLLISRLVPFEFSELLFLQSYETLVNRDATLGLVGAIGAGSGNDESTCLSTTDLEEYNRWMKYLDERFGGLTEFASEGLNRDFDATLRTVSAYLDRWDDSTRWDRLHKILETVPWHSYVTALRDLCDEFAAFVWNHSETRKDSTKRIRHQLEVTLDILKSAVDRLGLPDTGRVTVHPGGFDLAEVAERMLPSLWELSEFESNEEDIFREWDRLISCLDVLGGRSVDQGRIRNKCVQRQVLKRLYTRGETTEFLIS